MSEPAIRVRDVSKRFFLRHERARPFQERFIALFDAKRRSSVEEFWAVRDVSFDVSSGESIGLIGPNGTGKSTLLKMIGRILLPTAGSIVVNGHVSTLLELGAGFHPELTGLENIYLNGSLLGLSRRQIADRLDLIVGFSELERFIDTPVKHYSSGMQVRLGFSIAAHVDPDILLIDEALAVGDQHFQEKCAERFDGFRSEGKTLVLVSHSMAHIEQICTRAIWLDEGRVRKDGAPKEVVAEYQAAAASGPAPVNV